MKTRDELITKAREIIELWFEPWGAGKNARWMSLTNDMPYNPDLVLERILELLKEADALN